MSAFDDKKAIEAQALVVLLPFLHESSEGRYVLTSKGTLAKWLQESVGDVLINVNERLIAIELKAERRHTGNLFLETWSNKNLDSRGSHAERGSNPGWLLKIKADQLLYYFIDEDLLYAIDVFHLKRWAFGYGPKGSEKAGQLHRFPEKLVHLDQANDTWGRIVPVDVLRQELPPRALKQTNVRQRSLLPDAA